MNDNSLKVVEEMKKRNVSKMELAIALGMFVFSFQNRIERGLTDEETDQIMNILEGGNE